ncbi:ABC transporter permease [Nocardioides terrisoli]|uniref:ABC transporter permease n=1 Tax=Nocardioides terrisoli TaxID=3388267 RepID=UPI00287B7A25|nr:iron ABC transporter permease [Nocardioides marmorisolisilvae]
MISVLRTRWPLLLAAGVPLAALLVFFALPVGGMVQRGFWPDGRFDPAGVADVLGRARTLRVLWFTIWSAGIATAVAVLLGLPTAFCLHRLRFTGQGLVRALVMVPFVLPTVVVGVAFTQVFGIGGPLAGLHLDGSAAAIVAAMVFFNVSVVVRTVGSFWQAIDPRREQAAAALGASPRQVFLTVTVPSLLPAVVAAASVVFLFCATAFGVVLTMGGLRYSNVETEIYLLTTQELDLPSAAALSLLQLVLIVVLLGIVGRARRTPVERSSSPARRPGARDWPVLITAAAVVGFLLLPIVTLVEASLRVGGQWSLGNYRALGSTGSHHALLVPAVQALGTSLGIAVEACALALVLGLLVSYVVSRRPAGRVGRRLVAAFDGAFMLPLGVSAVTVGFGFLITLDRPPLDLRTSTVLIPIAQAMVALPLVVRTVAPVLSSIDDRQRQAAASLGAGPLRVFGTVDLPTAWRSVLAAAGFAFAVSLGEFGATSFLARSDDPTLPVVIYELLSRPGVMNFGMAMAASVVLAAATAGVMLLVERLRVSSLGAF